MDVKAELTRKLGPLPVWAWGAIGLTLAVAGYWWWTHRAPAPEETLPTNIKGATPVVTTPKNPTDSSEIGLGSTGDLGDTIVNYSDDPDVYYPMGYVYDGYEFDSGKEAAQYYDDIYNLFIPLAPFYDQVAQYTDNSPYYQLGGLSLNSNGVPIGEPYHLVLGQEWEGRPDQGLNPNDPAVQAFAAVWDNYVNPGLGYTNYTPPPEAPAPPPPVYNEPVHEVDPRTGTFIYDPTTGGFL